MRAVMPSVRRPQKPIAQGKKPCHNDYCNAKISGGRPNLMLEPPTDRLIERVLVHRLRGQSSCPRTWTLATASATLTIPSIRHSLPQAARALGEKTVTRTIAISRRVVGRMGSGLEVHAELMNSRPHK
jgi:hypothetical protein